VLEGQEPCGLQAWVQLRPPEWWDGEHEPHDGCWYGDDENAVIRAFRKAYPNRHPEAKGYLKYRVFPKPKVYVRANRG
jgi:hypothetical protein